MNAKRLADGLQEAGLLASVGDPADRRRRVLRPTAAGQALSREIEGRALEWSAILEAIIGRNDVVQLSMTLTRIEDGIAGLPGYEPPGGEAGHG
jgi:DNA-binding MarR family transcriptional regulator